MLTMECNQVAVIEEMESTTIVPPGWALKVLDSGALLIESSAT